MKKIGYLFQLLVLLGCSSNPMMGHWSSETAEDGKSATKFGLIISRGNKCTIYASPPNHSSFVGNCEYEVEKNKYNVYLLNEKGERWADPPFVYEYNSQTETLEWVAADGRIGLLRKKH